ncbi:MAG: hypothetical protein NC393_12760 [Clostridium sp.]|nr:hypothetical protein [Clostridium sp.]MCM1172981.1 hypothetical protein [Clostridium sp.]MCM1208483.1 hypothetical protein [Ruminococcus sp.]
MSNLLNEKEIIAREEELKAYFAKTAALNLAVGNATKEVNIQIAVDDIRSLMNSNYRMCFAKKVGNENYNVIWQSYKDFSENNTFSWTPQYQVFRTDTFQAGVTVKTASNPKTIGLGEKTTIDSYGILSDPVTGGDTTAINVDNEYKATHIGVCQLSTGIDGKIVSTPIYVSENSCMLGNASLKPVEKVMIWFEYNAETSTMFTDMKTRCVEVDLTQKNSVNLKYENEKWSTI